MTGLLNIDKPEGVTSGVCVKRAKFLTGTACGHFGTLDPLAGGVLPIGIGNAARLFEYFLEKEKRYIARFRFGWTTNTLDRESEPTPAGMVPTKSVIEDALASFLGDIEQVPPAFSAVSVAGKRSYKLARRGEEVELPPRRVHIKSFRMTGQIAPDEFEFDIVCGAGTYIRSLARDLGKAAGTGAYMTKLTRIESGIFKLENAVPLDALTRENVQDYIIPADSVLPFPALENVDPRFFHGVHTQCEAPDGIYKIYLDGAFYGTGAVGNHVLRPDKKLC